jgi:hypothetical protein
MKTTLKIFEDNQEIQFNTNTIGQTYLERVIGTLEFFRSYRCYDQKNGISVLDLGIISLRKILMSFIESYFTDIRNRLLAQKVERERYSVDKKLYKHFLSTHRLDILNAALIDINKTCVNFEKDKDAQQGIIGQIKTEIQTRERMIYNRRHELEEAKKSGVCPILKKKCLEIVKPITPEQNLKINTEIGVWEKEIVGYKSKLESEVESIEYYNDSLSSLRNEESKIKENLMRLKGAFQFKDYKYTKSDIVIFDEAVKVLDSFAGEYIKEWLSSLSVIINNLLRPINISVEFTADKDFLKVKDNDQTLKYDQLSAGQRCFLSVIFKLAILMQQNKTGIILMDDGLGSIDLINFKNLIEICKTLPFQIIAVYQNYINEIEDIKHFIVIREKGVSNVKMSPQ